jgi:putative hydrolase of the HAD superfamily
LDDTLIDFVGFKKKAVFAAACAMVSAGLKADPKKLVEGMLEFYYSYGIESDDAFTRFLEKEYGRAEPRFVAAGVTAYLKEKYAYLKPFPRVVETLRKLKKKGLKLGVVSDGVRLKAWMRLNAAGLDKYFDTVVTFDDTGKKKPAKEPFLKACKELNVKPEECLMVGDWIERDIEGAKALGMKTCLTKHGHFALVKEKLIGGSWNEKRGLHHRLHDDR